MRHSVVVFPRRPVAYFTLGAFHVVRFFTVFILLFSTCCAVAGDPPEVLFSLGSWQFQLSTAGNAQGGIDSVLVARHPKRGVVGFSRLDPRVCAAARDIQDRDGKIGRAASELIVELAGPNWTARETFAAFPPAAPDAATALKAFLAALRAEPPTRGYKKRFDYLTAQHAKP